MKTFKEFLVSQGFAPYCISDRLHETIKAYASHVLDEAAQRAEAVLMGSGDYWADVDPKSILDLKNEL